MGIASTRVLLYKSDNTIYCINIVATGLYNIPMSCFESSILYNNILLQCLSINRCLCKFHYCYYYYISNGLFCKYNNNYINLICGIRPCMILHIESCSTVFRCNINITCIIFYYIENKVRISENLDVDTIYFVPTLTV